MKAENLGTAGENQRKLALKKREENQSKALQRRNIYLSSEINENGESYHKMK